jgi:predicted NBD/HSP70 family sugar kinase
LVLSQRQDLRVLRINKQLFIFLFAYLSIKEAEMKILALDIGGTHIRIAEVSGINVTNKKDIKTPNRKKDILKAIFSCIKSYEKFSSIGVSVAGFERNGIMQHSLNTDINDISLSGILKKEFKVPVFVENDANCAGLAELHFGAGKGKKNFVLLTLGTGIGGAAIVNGKLYIGNGGAMEPGSMIIDKEKIFEYWASGNASVRIAREEFGFKGISSLELEEKANNGNKKAIAVYDKVGRYLGIGLLNLTFIFDPDILILGGGFARVKHIYPPMEKAFKEFYNITPVPPIVRAKLGVDAGLIGAGLLTKK